MEANMLRQKASPNANLHLLQCQITEAKADEEVEFEIREHSQLPDIEEEPLSTVQRTNEYVQQHFEFLWDQLLKHVAVESLGKNIDKLEMASLKPASSHDFHANLQPVQKYVGQTSRMSLGY